MLTEVPPALESLSLNDLHEGLQDIASTPSAPEPAPAPSAPESLPSPTDSAPETTAEPVVTPEPTPEPPKEEKPAEEAPAAKIDDPFGLTPEEPKKEEKPKEEPKAAVVEEDDGPEALPDGSQKKQREAFAHKERRLKEEKKRRLELEAKVAEYEAKLKEPPKVNPEELPEYKEVKIKAETYAKQLEEREKALQEYEQRERIWNVENSREYKEKVLQPWQQIQQNVSTLAKEKQINPASIFAVVQATDRQQRKELFTQLVNENELSVLDQQEIIQQVATFDKIAADAAFLKQNAAEAQQVLTQKQREQQEVVEREIRKTINQTRQQIREKADPQILKDIEEFSDLATEFKSRNETLDKFFESGKSWIDIPLEKQGEILEVHAKAPLLINALKRKLTAIQQEKDAKIADLEKRNNEKAEAIKRLTSSAPESPGGSGSRKPDGEKIDAKDGFDIGDSIAEIMRG